MNRDYKNELQRIAEALEKLVHWQILRNEKEVNEKKINIKNRKV